MKILAIFSIAFFCLQGYSMICKGKGCLIERNSNQVVLYFRGHVRGLGGKPGRIPKYNWTKSARQLLNKAPYRLKKYNISPSLYATGSSHLSLSNSEIRQILNETGARQIILAAHSGGYLGMRNTISNMSGALLKKVVSVQMLDNFYSASSTSRILKNRFSRKFLQKKCFGYTTPHNRARYNQFFKSVCPQVSHLANGNHVSGLRCMTNFSRGISRCR